VSETLQVLLVEDNAGDARLLQEMFSKERAGSFELTHLLRMSEAVTHLAKGGVDVVLLDLGLPDGHGLDTVRRAHAVAPGVPVIVLTGLDDEALAADAMAEGAQDYLIKGQIESRALPRALRHAIERYRMLRETEALRINQMQFKDEFLSHVSHELRSPLAAIYQFVTILLDRLAGELEPKQHQYLEVVLRNVKQLQSMINDLLEVTRMQAGKLTIEVQSTSVADAIGYAVNTLQGAADAKGVNLSADAGSGLQPLPFVCADPTRLRQILIILLDNAIKFSPANGVVKVRARIPAGSPGSLRLEVSDTGCGISPHLTERIFERLFQAADPASAGRKGLGLGLYICKDLVTRQGGRIWVENASGQGSVFCVTLPVFSLPDMVDSIVRKARRQDSSLSFVVAEIESKTGWISDEVRTEHSQGVRDLLQGCLHSDLDVLLPRIGTSGAVELFFIVAVTDQIGAEAIVARIQRRMGRSEYVQQAGLIVSTSSQLLAMPETDANESSDHSAAKMSGQIQELIDFALTSRKMAHAK
jgi:sigma-B regulation protein RsbU (phosphoserine phosphatase)